jgi:putative tricarboxylic transport membrane protein
MLRYGYSTAAAAITVVLGAGAERSLRTGLNLTRNDWSAFVSRPLTAAILTIALAILVYGIWGMVRQSRLDRAGRQRSARSAINSEAPGSEE